MLNTENLYGQGGEIPKFDGSEEAKKKLFLGEKLLEDISDKQSMLNFIKSFSSDRSDGKFLFFHSKGNKYRSAIVYMYLDEYKDTNKLKSFPCFTSLGRAISGYYSDDAFSYIEKADVYAINKEALPLIEEIIDMGHSLHNIDLNNLEKYLYEH